MTNVMHKFLIYFIYLFTSALHVSGFLLANLQRQAYNFSSSSSMLGMVSAPQEIGTTAEVVLLPMKMG
jgi:hypothetical protein